MSPVSLQYSETREIILVEEVAKQKFFVQLEF